MKLLAAALGFAGAACAAISSLQGGRPTTILVTGDLAGHLEPCGCTLPTTGGILRQATLVKQLRTHSNVVVLVNGAMIASSNALAVSSKKQDEYKIETLAQAYDTMEVSAINLSPEDAKLGAGGVLAVQNITKGKLISGSVASNSSLPIPETSQSGPFLIGGAAMQPRNLAMPLGSQPVDIDEAVSKLVGEAKQLELAPILLLDGADADAREVAAKYPDLRLIVYRSPNESPVEPEKVGRTQLVTPGEGGKSVVTITFDGRNFDAYQVVRLGPEFKDDLSIAKIYDEYLGLVDRAGFLDRIDRLPSKAYAGSKTCENCHKASYNVWAHSKHAGAYASLEIKKHAHDPDCVYCHVVGLKSETGFRSLSLSPNLASVGCESCHGPGRLHALNPHAEKLAKVKLSSCASCHTSEQSPNFNPLTFWPKIEHK